jgi:hypothetical protein
LNASQIFIFVLDKIIEKYYHKMMKGKGIDKELIFLADIVKFFTKLFIGKVIQ